MVIFFHLTICKKYLGVSTLDKVTFQLESGHQYINGIEYSQVVMTVDVPYASIYYFSANYNGSSWFCKRARTFRSYMQKGNNLIRDFYPALRISDSKPGLYDLVNNQFYTNAGTGEFLYN